MEGVEDIPGAVLDEGIDWTWESFGEYLDAVERRPHDIDLCAQLPHGALRLYVMGERAARLEDATEDDAAAMRSLATEAMRAGAVGFSTSRTLNHRTASGDPTPSLRARADELEAIALGVADAGHGVVELISDFWPDTDGEFELVRGIVARSGVPLSLSLSQSHRQPEAWRDLLAPDRGGRGRRPAHPGAGGAARGRGCWSGCSPRTTRSSASPPSARSPGCPVARAGACAARPRRSGRASWRSCPMTTPTGAGAAAAGVSSTTGACSRWATSPTTSPPRSRAWSVWPQARGVDPAALTLDLLAEDDGRDFLYTPFSNYADGNLDACGEMLRHPDTVFGLGDGGAHVGLIADASFPT